MTVKDYNRPLEKKKCESINSQEICDKGYYCEWDTEKKKCYNPWIASIKNPIKEHNNEDIDFIRILLMPLFYAFIGFLILGKFFGGSKSS